MITGKVVGTVVATNKVETLISMKFLIVRRMNITGKLSDDYVVAVDAVDAGVGEIVLVATGSAARQTDFTDKRPVDAIIMAIVDTFEVDNKIVYQKN